MEWRENSNGKLSTNSKTHCWIDKIRFGENFAYKLLISEEAEEVEEEEKVENKNRFCWLTDAVTRLATHRIVYRDLTKAWPLII